MFSVVSRRVLTSSPIINVSLRTLNSRAVVISQVNAITGTGEQGQWRKVHTSRKVQADATDVVGGMKEEKKVREEKGIIGRFVVTAEVTVSKIFPAGFGWQSASIVADGQGYSADSMAFALTTGFGDAVGVLLGHCAYYGAKKAVLSDASIDMKRELHTGILLASAAMCSGTAWQPLVNILQGANISFPAVFAGTWIGCGSMFYFGLRAGRTILPTFLEHVHEPTYENSTRDAALSVAIGGATGFFVGTDAAYLPDQNFLLDVVGIKDGTPDLTGCAIAGSSTALGFCTAQTGMNLIYPKGKSWND